MQQHISPVEGAQAGDLIQLVHAECQALVRDKRYAEVVEAADRLRLFVLPGNRNSTRLFAIRIWKVDALFKLGRGREALEYLEWVEEFNGATFATRNRAARLHSYFADHAACERACVDALVALPLAKERPPEYRHLCHMRAEALNMMGRREEAAAFLSQALRGLVPTYEDMAAIRRTVTSHEGLQDYFDYLLPHFSYPGQRARHALFHFSIACRDNGEPKRAIYVARQRFLSGLRIVKFGERKQPERVNWSGDAAAALLDLREDLARLGLDFFLISGTLLGCVRDGDIIGHDKDVDVGVITDLPISTLHKFMSATGRFKVKPVNSNKLVQVRHANGVMIDIFYHWREDGLLFHEGLKCRWWNSDIDLTEVNFLGTSFYAPSDAPRYLSENYGARWDIPEPEFETFVDTPNMIVQDVDHLIWYYYVKLHDYYFNGKSVQLRKVWDALRELDTGDATVAAAMRQALGGDMIKAVAS